MEKYFYTVQIEPAEEGGFIASIPAIPGCHTQGETLERTIRNAEEAITAMLVSYMKHGEGIPIEEAEFIPPPLTSPFAARVSIQADQVAT